MTPLDLLKTNVNEHTEKKANLTYLSWAWAWAEIIKADPAANYEVKTFEGLPYMHLGDSAMVWVTVTVFGKSITCQLPVLDYRNKCIPKPNAFEINTSIMRCLTKGIALHGLGLYIYAGEDLPEGEEPEQKTVVKVETKKAVAKVEINEANMALFADGMIQFVDLCKDEADLKSYWKNNHSQIELLKTHKPELYASVLARFQEAKAKFNKE